jgi:hypothetical protein
LIFNVIQAIYIYRLNTAIPQLEYHSEPKTRKHLEN